MVMFENALQFIGAFVAFSIAIVAYKGVRETSSSSMLRLAAAFVFLGTGFVLEGLEGVGAFASIPVLEVSLATILLAGLFLQTVGYFFLAFSHVLDVVLSRRVGPLLILLPIFAVSQASGFVGGPIFPALFIGGTVGVLVHEVLPGIPLGLAFTCLLAAVPGSLAAAPFSMVLLAAFLTQVGALQTAPILIAVVTAFLTDSFCARSSLRFFSRSS